MSLPQRPLATSRPDPDPRPGRCPRNPSPQGAFQLLTTVKAGSLAAIALVATLAACGNVGSSLAAHPTPGASPSSGNASPATILEYAIPTANSAPWSITSGSDGALWFTESAAGKIGRVTSSGAFTEYTIPGGRDPGYIAAGSDGALWFTEYYANTIGRITTTGEISEYTTGNSSPHGITTGPDGALWFTEFGGIGRISLSGKVTEHQVPGKIVWAITAGPDGALWFTEGSGNKGIGRMTASGALTEYAIPSFEALSITAGRDGALWFTETDSGKIGRITTSGAVTEYAIPPTTSVPAGVSAAPGSITSGPDGALWFKATAMVGRLTTAGAFTSFTISNATSGPEAIASGPDGALWFTEDNDNSKIGRITPSRSPNPRLTKSYSISAPVTATGWIFKVTRCSLGSSSRNFLPV